MITRLTIACSLVLITSAQAANVVVQKNGQFPTIQAGINAAGANGTVTVKSGVYEETPVISSNLDGLTLKASGNVIIDARLANGAADGPGIQINADDVTVRGFTIRHAANAGAGKPGAGVRITAPGALLDKLKIVDSSETGIQVESTGTTIRNCVFIGCGYGVYASSANETTVENCTVSLCSSYGIFVNGSNPLVRKNVVKHANGYGLYVAGPDAIVEKNTITNTGSNSIYVSATFGSVRNNKVFTCFDGAGINVSGDGNTIENNFVSDSKYEGIYASGSQLTLRKNRVRTTGSSDEGIYVSGGTAIVVESNVVENSGYAGIYVSCDTVTARKNVVMRSGRYLNSPAGFYFSGNGGIIEKNVAKECHGDGFQVYLSNADILNNVAIGNTADGFDLNGANCDVFGNVALKNLAEGFDLSGSNTSFKNNTAKNNRIDIAASVMPTSFQANDYGTGGSSTLPEID